MRSSSSHSAVPFLLLALLAAGCEPAPPGGPDDGGGLRMPPPELTALSLGGLPLIPRFDPAIHDYAVRCEAGLTTTFLHAAATEGARVVVQAPPGAVLNAALDLEEGSLVVLVADDGRAFSRTFVRCLPHDLPGMQVTLHPENGDPTPGWYLLGNTVVGAYSGSYAMVLDHHGTPVWYQRMGGAMDVDVLATDVLGLTPYLAARADDSGTFTELHLDTGASRTIAAVPGLPLDPHELQRLPDGSTLELAMPLVPGVDLTGLFSYGQGTTLMDCVVQVRDPGGLLLWSWRASEHFDPVQETTVDYPVTVGGAAVADAFHCNSVEDDGQGGFIVSARHLDAVFRVDRATGRVTWKLGGAGLNPDGARQLQVVGDPNGGFYRQHDARLTPDGTLSVFDDESLLDRPARAVEYRLDLDAGTATLAFAHAGSDPSAAMGSFRRLDDGARVVGWGWSPGQVALTELSPQGAPVLELSFTDGSHAYRSLKVGPGALTADRLRNF